ncbi:hypothetical protein [Devosia sp.]|uniref:hypothetical protein n=1 Tax=Devosia sp. TaxID=1871048 RepID=UPI001A0F01AB|nr:hypothetical protein [Devosia sp.]MBE0577947.1 hypothetical protein [Devosia sp.]
MVVLLARDRALAAFHAMSLAGGQAALHRRASVGRSTAEDGEGEVFCFALQSVAAWPRGGKHRDRTIAGPQDLRPYRLLEGHWRGHCRENLLGRQDGSPEPRNIPLPFPAFIALA